MPCVEVSSTVLVLDVLGDALAVAEWRTWGALAWPRHGRLSLTVGAAGETVRSPALRRAESYRRPLQRATLAA
jgi:hypothetical protein